MSFILSQQSRKEIKSVITYAFIPNLLSFSPHWNAVADFTPQVEKMQMTSVRQYGFKLKLSVPKGSEFLLQRDVHRCIQETQNCHFLKGTNAQEHYACHMITICIWRRCKLGGKKHFLPWKPHKNDCAGQGKNSQSPICSSWHWKTQREHRSTESSGSRRNQGLLNYSTEAVMHSRQRPWSLVPCQGVTYLPQMENVFFLLEHSLFDKKTKFISQSCS